MKAIVFHGNKDVRLENIAEPQCAPDEVKVQVGYNGICGSDLHEYFDGPCYAPVEKHALGAQLPLVFGHEFAGVVTEVGSKFAGRFKVGQKVAVEASLSCNNCQYCTEGTPNLCDSVGFVGVSCHGGGLQEYTCVKGHKAHILPDNVSLKHGAMVEPLATAWHGVRAAQFQKGQTALVVGAGPVGVLTVKALLAFGASKVFVSEPSATRAKTATLAGATKVFNPIKEDAVAAVLAETGGLGVDAAFDAAGVPKITLSAALRATKKRGRVVSLAVYTTPTIPLDIPVLQFGERILTSTIAYTPKEFAEVIQAISEGKLGNLDQLITAELPLEKTQQALNTLHSANESQVKILIRVNETEPKARL